MPEIIAGIRLPDSAIARAATQLVRNTEDGLLYNHSRRVFFGARSPVSVADCNTTGSCFILAPCSTTWALPENIRAPTFAWKSTAPMLHATS
jgi:hypothetical protein